MVIKYGKPNPLNLLDLRRVKFPAHHFHYMSVPRYTPILVKTIDNWIFNNLTGRYYVGQAIDLDSTNSVIYVTKIGFENEKEMSFFLLTHSNL